MDMGSFNLGMISGAVCVIVGLILTIVFRKGVKIGKL